MSAPRTPSLRAKEFSKKALLLLPAVLRKEIKKRLLDGIRIKRVLIRWTADSRFVLWLLGLAHAKAKLFAYHMAAKIRRRMAKRHVLVRIERNTAATL